MKKNLFIRGRYGLFEKNLVLRVQSYFYLIEINKSI